MDQVSAGIHWLTFACRGRSSDEVLAGMGGGHGRAEDIGGFGHPRSLVHESGSRVYFGASDDSQPVVVNVPGEVCDAWSEQAVSWAVDLGAYVTRVDLAADLEPSDKARRRLVEMRRAWKRRQVETRMSPSSHEWMSNAEGCTAYFGGRQAAVRLRAYDRRGPLRLEFQWRPDDRKVRELLPKALQRWGPMMTWRTLAAGVKFPMPWYRQLLAGETLEFTRAAAEESSLEQVADQLREQFGRTLWAMRILGMQLTDLAVAPEAPMRGDLAAKFLRWAAEGERQGYDGEKLRQEVRCRLN